MGAAAYRRGSRLIARQIAADFGLPGEVERKPTPRPADWGSKAQEKALVRARSILASSLRLGGELTLDVLAGTVHMVTAVGEATARAAAQRAMEENMTTLDDLVEELNRAAEYAGFPERLVITGTPVADNPRQVILRFADETYLVDIAWAIGSARRLPDKTSPTQMAEALALSHPEVLGVGAKHPPRNA